MKTVWKLSYPLSCVGNEIEFDCPKGAEPISAINQPGEAGEETLCIYVLVDPKKPKAARQFRVAGTGHQLNHDVWASGKFLGTVSFRGGNLILHVWDMGEV